MFSPEAENLIVHSRVRLAPAGREAFRRAAQTHSRPRNAGAPACFIAPSPRSGAVARAILAGERASL